MSATTSGMGRVAAERRFARVAEQVRSIRGRSGTARADTWMLYFGGFVYFGYWQTVRIRESRQQSLDLTAAVARLETLLSSAGSVGGTAVAGAAYVATPSGSIFHRPDCTVVTGRDDLVRVDPSATKLDACRICSPLEGANGLDGGDGPTGS